jgi:3-hydroxybutyryl-CoA dehydrogenase
MNTNKLALGPVAIIGPGLMGRSIAACLLAAGHTVTAVTNDLEGSAAASQRIHDLLQEMRQEGLLLEDAAAVMRRFTLTDCLSDAAGAEIVFETVTEDLTLKRKLLQEAERVVSLTFLLPTPLHYPYRCSRKEQRILNASWESTGTSQRMLRASWRSFPARLLQSSTLIR